MENYYDRGPQQDRKPRYAALKRHLEAVVDECHRTDLFVGKEVNVHGGIACGQCCREALSKGSCTRTLGHFRFSLTMILLAKAASFAVASFLVALRAETCRFGGDHD